MATKECIEQTGQLINKFNEFKEIMNDNEIPETFTINEEKFNNLLQIGKDMQSITGKILTYYRKELGIEE